MYIINTIKELHSIQNYPIVFEISINEICESFDINKILLCENLEKIKIYVKRNSLKLLLNNLHKYEKLYDIVIYNTDSSKSLPIIGGNKSFINEHLFYCVVDVCLNKHYKYVCDKCDTIYKLRETTVQKVIIKNNKIIEILNSLPNTIEELTLYANSNTDILLTNLPVGLNKLLVVTNMNVDIFYEKYIKKIKIPFGCKVIIVEEFNKEKLNKEYKNRFFQNRLLILE
jgi:hypothetical protein